MKILQNEKSITKQPPMIEHKAANYESEYEAGYCEGYRDAIVDMLFKMGVDNAEEFFK